MGGLAKTIGESFDPVSGRFNPGGLISPEVRSNNVLKRSMMQEELNASQARRRLATQVADEAIVESGDPIRARARGRQISQEIKAEGGTKGDVRLERRARGLGKPQIENLEELERSEIAFRTSLKTSLSEVGLDPSVADLWSRESLEKYGINRADVRGRMNAHMEALQRDNDLQMGRKSAEDKISREFEIFKNGELRKRDISEAQIKQIGVDTALDSKHADRIRRIRAETRAGSTGYYYAKGPFAKKAQGKSPSGAAIDTVRTDLAKDFVAIVPERSAKDIAGNPRIPLSEEGNVSSAGYDYEGLRESGATPRASKAAALSGMLESMGKSSMSFIAPFERPAKDKGKDSRFSTSMSMQNSAISSFGAAVERQTTMAGDPVTKQRAIEDPRRFFLEIEAAVRQAGVPARLETDADGALRFVPDEGYEQTGLPPEFLDRLTAELYERLERAKAESSESAGKKRRAGVR